MTRPLSRRHTLAGAATAGVALPVLAACGSDETTNGSGNTATDPTSSSAPNTSSAAPTTAEESSQAAPTQAPVDGLVASADVPVGGGVILSDEQIVVTQPTAGDFKAFSAVCTHESCLVATVSSTIDCPCHGSKFDLTTGDVVAGPASSALPSVAVSVDGDQVVRS